MIKARLKFDICRREAGVVLLMTLVLVVVLSALGYTLTSKVSAKRHRNRYIIDYQKARYACDSAIKYTLATLEDVNDTEIIARPNEPDFSDIFALDPEDYEFFIEEWRDWLIQRAEELEEENEDYQDDFKGFATDMNTFEYDSNQMRDFESEDEFGDMPEDQNEIVDLNDIANIGVRGPYGPQWPLLKEPYGFLVGSVVVRVEIIDENAKFPLAWGLIDDPNIDKEAQASLMTFCDWMDINDIEVESLREQFDAVNEIKPFKLKFETKTITEKKVVSKPTGRSVRGRRTTYRRTLSEKKTITAESHTTAFAKLFHSSLIDRDLLGRALIDSDKRKESALKYLGMWGSTKVNINTAPRHVLEAAFSFGGDSVGIAERIIEERRIKSFEDLEDLSKRLYVYSDSIKKCERFILTKSRFFTVKVDAVSGSAKASAIVAVIKEGKTPVKIAVLSD